MNEISVSSGVPIRSKIDSRTCPLVIGSSSLSKITLLGLKGKQ